MAKGEVRRAVSKPHKRRLHIKWVERDGQLAVAKIVEPQKPNCFYCGKPSGVTKDHVIPRSMGGQRGENLVNACLQCNHEKADMLLDEYRAKVALAQGIEATDFYFYGERT